MKDLARRINFFAASFIGVLGISLTAELFREHDFPDKIDDFLMLLLSLAAIYWYKKTGYKLNKSIGAVVIFIIAILIKILAIYIERGDNDALGDDFGIIAALAVGFVFVVWQTIANGQSKNG